VMPQDLSAVWARDCRIEGHDKGLQASHRRLRHYVQLSVIQSPEAHAQQNGAAAIATLTVIERRAGDNRASCVILPVEGVVSEVEDAGKIPPRHALRLTLRDRRPQRPTRLALRLCDVLSTAVRRRCRARRFKKLDHTADVYIGRAGWLNLLRHASLHLPLLA